MHETAVVLILYRNYRGEAAERCIVPNAIYFGSNQWHPEPQWLLNAYDLDKGFRRTFAMKDIQRWRSA